MRQKFREQLRSREALAIQHTPNDAARTRADIMDLLCGEPVKPNEDIGGCVVVHIRGPLEQRNVGYGDSYEQIRERFGEALKSDAECIVLRIDSPGGVVAGLNQAIYDMTRAKEASGKHVVVYCDELIASAAYGITCVGDEVWIPPSGHMGSIGVISTMVDTVKADEKAGLNFVTLTSGARKDDGHPHTAISDDAIAEEQMRVNKLAGQFFRIVKRARGIDAQPLEANLFLGVDAVKAGLADEVGGWEQLLVDIREVYGSGKAAGVRNDPGKNDTGEADMLKLKAMIRRVEAQLATEKDAKKRSALAAQLGAFQATLSAYKKTYKKTEEEETEEGGEEEEEEEEGGNETDREEDDMPGDEPDKEESAEGDDKEESAEGDDKEERAEDDKEESKAEGDDKEERAEDDDGDKDAFSTPGKRAAILAKAKAFDAIQGDVKRLVSKDARTAKLSTIAAARAAGRITKAHAKMLEKKPRKFVDDFLSMHKAALVYSIDDESPETIPSDNGPKAAVGDIPPDVMRQFISAANASRGQVTIETLIANYKKDLATSAGRY